MPTIPYQAIRFSAYPPTRKLSAGVKGKTKTGSQQLDLTEIANYAVGVGDTSILGAHQRRPWLELVWRAAMALSSLDEQNDYFVRSASYNRLDPSEKSAVSYFLGMTQCAAMADKVLNARITVHVDAFLSLLGKTIPNMKRPDLVGFSVPPGNTKTPGRFLLEAKGRTGGFSQSAINSALKQLQTPPKEVLNLVGPNAIRAASLAYFESPARNGLKIWKNYLEDPPSPDEEILTELSDDEFCGLIVITQLLPIYRTMSGLKQLSKEFTTHDIGELLMTPLPLEGISIGMPNALYSALSEIEAPLINEKKRKSAALSIWQMVSEANYAKHLSEVELKPTEELSVRESGLSVLHMIPQDEETDG